MVLKVSVSLPGNAVITVEASEPQLFHEVVNVALRELPMGIIQLQAGTGPELVEAPSKSVISNVSLLEKQGPQGEITSAPPSPDPVSPAGEGEESFAGFCSGLSPLGDMRRVVVAAEGARMFLGMQSVSEVELGQLFDLAGWRRAPSFLQALRNAARSKFRWLERVPGNPGYYFVTDAGREKVGASGEG